MDRAEIVKKYLDQEKEGKGWFTECVYKLLQQSLFRALFLALPFGTLCGLDCLSLEIYSTLHFPIHNLFLTFFVGSRGEVVFTYPAENLMRAIHTANSVCCFKEFTDPPWSLVWTAVERILHRNRECKSCILFVFPFRKGPKCWSS